MKKTLIAIACLLLLFTKAHADQVVLGVLEEPQKRNLEDLSVRILFGKQGRDWIALDHPDVSYKFNIHSIEWTVAFDGRNLGSIKSIDPDPNKEFVNDWYYKRDKLFLIDPGSKVPRLKNKSKSFSGWVEAPSYRPLILVSKPYFTDPEKWKPFKPDNSFKNKLYVPLKLVIGRFNAVKCVDDQLEPYHFKPEELILYKGYKNKTGRELISIGLDRKRIDCDYYVTAPEWKPQWFLLDGNNIEYIGRAMTLVDAGDYDNDGRSELVFWHSGYNRDGYVLIYNNFEKKVEYIWGYH